MRTLSCPKLQLSPEATLSGVKCNPSCAKQNKFNESQSSTFWDGGDDSEMQVVWATGGGVTPVNGSDTAMALREAADYVTIGGYSVYLGFFLVLNQTEVFADDPYDGIIGESSCPAVLEVAC